MNEKQEIVLRIFKGHVLERRIIHYGIAKIIVSSFGFSEREKRELYGAWNEWAEYNNVNAHNVSNVLKSLEE